tara:strand:- start:545 stop:700 length:156 start_codon:yes stop_codon:yes gene_type:complete
VGSQYLESEDTGGKLIDPNANPSQSQFDRRSAQEAQARLDYYQMLQNIPMD